MNTVKKPLSELLKAIENDVTFSTESISTVPPRYILKGIQHNWLVTIQYKNGPITKTYYKSPERPDYISTIAMLFLETRDSIQLNTVQKVVDEFGLLRDKSYEDAMEVIENTKRSLRMQRENRKQLRATFGTGMYRRLLSAENDV